MKLLCFHSIYTENIIHFILFSDALLKMEIETMNAGCFCVVAEMM